MFEYPTIQDVITIHELLINKSGGSHGIRDEGAISSALARPQNGYYDGLIGEAAAILESLAVNHPFVDGNKRIALAMTEVFLGMNGYEIVLESQEETHAFMIGLFEADNFKFEPLKEWLESVVVELE